MVFLYLLFKYFKWDKVQESVHRKIVVIISNVNRSIDYKYVIVS